MIAKPRSLLIVVGLLQAPVLAAGAQTLAPHVWGGESIGYGLASFSCAACDYRAATGTDATRLNGWDFSMAFGWTSYRHVRLGIEYTGWLNGLKRNDSLPGMDIGMAFVSYSPHIRRGIYLEGGVALTHYTLGLGTGDPIEPHQRTDDFAAGYGWGYGFGIGWKGRGSFTPRVSYLHGLQPRLHAPSGETVATRWSQDMLLVGIGYRSRS